MQRTGFIRWSLVVQRQPDDREPSGRVLGFAARLYPSFTMPGYRQTLIFRPVGPRGHEPVFDLFPAPPHAAVGRCPPPG